MEEENNNKVVNDYLDGDLEEIEKSAKTFRN